MNNSNYMDAPCPPIDLSSDFVIPFVKKSGVTSYQSLGIIKRALATRHVGHTGTLDSFASGLLILCTGRLTKLVPYITALDKTYIATIRFGTLTDTLDPTGTVTSTSKLPTLAAFENAVKIFTGQFSQVPPLYSAIKIGGVRASDAVRAGQVVKIPERKVTVYDSVILTVSVASSEDEGALPSEEREYPMAKVSTTLKSTDLVSSARVRFRVSKGTYIRSLARDIAIKAGGVAHLSALERTAVGGFSIEEAVDLSATCSAEEARCKILARALPPSHALAKKCALDLATLPPKLARLMMEA